MGQANSTHATPESGSQHPHDHPHQRPSSSPSSSTPWRGGDATPVSGNPVGGSSHLPHLPTVEDLRNMTHRILASSADKLQQLRENIPSVELPKLGSSNSSPVSPSEDQFVTSPPSESPSPSLLSSSSEKVLDQPSQDMLENQVTRMTIHDQSVFVVESPSPTATTTQPTNNSGTIIRGNSISKKDQSLKEVIKIHYQLSASWIKRNASTVAIVGVAAIVGIMALRAASARRQKRRLDRVVRGRGGAKREIVVITSVATLEGVTLALALEQKGFIVFVGVEDSEKANEVNSWGRHDIHPLVLDPSKPHVVEAFVNAIIHFLDLRNGELLGLGLPVTPGTATEVGSTHAPTSSMAWNNDHARDHSGSFLVQEELSMSTANIHFLQPTSASSVGLHQNNNNNNNFNSTNHNFDNNNPSDSNLASRIGLYPSLAHHTDVVVQREQHATTADQGAPVFRLAAIIVQPPATVVVGSIEHVDLELWRRAFDVNVVGSIIILQKFMPLLRRTLTLPSPCRSPRVLLLSSSVTGNLGLPHQSVLSASHHAIESLADSLRREVQHQGIDVVCLKPGVIESSERKELRDKQQQSKMARSNVGLFSSMDWSKAFISASTTNALQDVVYDVVTMKRPAAYVAMGSGSTAYAFVAWAMPRAWVDWAIRRNPPKIVHRTVKVTKTPASTLSSSQHEE
ncbi:hypothetical protein BGZ73_006319 [Actinomortierella ambigua]|nr:hypothetical protein BGZ73_006319 [Actinomortierella ambigua]